jgi:secreted Zn-dependent insulinase-like peptidase
MHELGFKYKDEQSPDDLVEGFSEDMAPYLMLPPERLLDGMALMFEFDEDCIENYLDNYLTPENGRIDLTSTTFGRAADFDDATATEGTETKISDLRFSDECEEFNVASAGSPQVEPMFGTRFWASTVPFEWIDHWKRLSEPQQPTIDIGLPPRNPFIPTTFHLKPLPDHDSHHPLLDCSLKLCITVGKTKQWFPATPIQYNKTNKSLLMSYEDENEQWHAVDGHFPQEFCETIVPGHEGTLDKQAIKYRVLAVAVPGRGGVRRYGDDSDFDVENGKAFPPIPPSLAPSRLPLQLSDSNVLKMWWLQDRHFHRPMAEFRVQIVCRSANESPIHRACSDVMQQLCVDYLVESGYLASLCDLHYQIESCNTGFVVCTEGFDDKLMDLLKSALTILLSFRQRHDGLPDGIGEDRFKACVEVLDRTYRNSGVTASKLCLNVRLRALRPSISSANQKLRALAMMDIELFSRTAFSIMQDFAIEAFYHGNADMTDALKAKNMILDLVGESAGLSRKKYPAQSVLKVPFGLTPTNVVLPSLDPNEPNTGT